MMFVPSVLGGVIGAVTGAYKAQKSQKTAANKAQKLLIKMELKRLHKSICVDREGCDLTDKEDATQLYESYRELGGNGTGESMYKDIMKAEVTV